MEALLGLGSLEALETESTTTLEAARAVAADVGLLGQVTGLDMMLGEHLLLVGGPPAARDLAEDLVERGAALRLPAAELAGRYVLALAPAVAGRRDELERHLQRLDDGVRRPGGALPARVARGPSPPSPSTT